MTDKEIIALARKSGLLTQFEAISQKEEKRIIAFTKAVQNMQREESAEIVKAFEPGDIDLYNAIRANTSPESDIEQARRKT